MTISINPKEIPSALAYGSLVISVRKNHFGREIKTVIGEDGATSEECSVFYSPSRGFVRIDCEPSEAFLEYQKVIL